MTKTAPRLPVSLKAFAEREDFEGVRKSVPTFSVDPRIIQVREGFNGRPIDLEHVATLKAARTNGVDLPPCIVAVTNGVIEMLDGHHRLYDVMQDIQAGIDIKSIQCLEFKSQNMADRIMLMVGSQSGLAMTPLQLGVQYKNLVNGCGWSEKDVATKRGRSVQHVKDMIQLSNSNYDVQALVTSGQVAGKTALAAVKAQKNGGADAGTVLAAAVKAAQAGGKTKATGKHVKTVPLAKLGDSFVQQHAANVKVAKGFLAGMIESPSINPAVRQAVQIVIDTIGGKPNDATAPTKLETGLYWLQELAANKQGSERVRAAARWFHDNLYSGAFVKGTAGAQPSVMALEDAIKTEMESDGEVMAESLCPEHAALIVYLRKGVR